jgi:hypothetical protein
MDVEPENKFGYLSLTTVVNSDEDGSNNIFVKILVKANKIKSIREIDSSEPTAFVWSFSEISVGDKKYITVEESIEEIIKQLENIHPDMR